ncbi:MAG: sugar transferase [bacterium JZ-2024 1]
MAIGIKKKALSAFRDFFFFLLIFAFLYFIRFQVLKEWAGGYGPFPLYVLYGLVYAFTTLGYLIFMGYYDEQPYFDAPGRKGFSYFSASTVGVVSLIFTSYLFHLTDPSRLLLIFLWFFGWFFPTVIPVGRFFQGKEEIWVIAEDADALAGALTRTGQNREIRLFAPEEAEEKVKEGVLPGAVVIQWKPEFSAGVLNHFLSRHIPVYLAPDVPRMYVPSMSVDYLGGMPLLVPRPLYASLSGRVFKFLLDVPVAALLFIFTLPLFVVLALMIMRESPGNPFYGQWRVGMGGKKFLLWKFRTMIPRAEEWLNAHPEAKKEYEGKYKLEKDPRVLRIGRWIRKYSLDELPQLVNVLKGEMSLVGPRPVVEQEVAKYGELAPILLSVKPGITGLWQVSGRSLLSYEQRIFLDITYIQSWSAWLDIKILLLTLPAVLKARGAF